MYYCKGINEKGVLLHEYSQSAIQVTKRGIWLPSAGLSTLRRECELFHGENHFEMHALDPEIWLFENTSFLYGYTPLILTTC